jgi:hypothetical protein
MNYAVVWIRSGSVAYVGPSLRKAAEAFEPGTCYGRARSAGEAMATAQKWAQWFAAKDQPRRKLA